MMIASNGNKTYKFNIPRYYPRIQASWQKSTCAVTRSVFQVPSWIPRSVFDVKVPHLEEKRLRDWNLVHSIEAWKIWSAKVPASAISSCKPSFETSGMAWGPTRNKGWWTSGFMLAAMVATGMFWNRWNEICFLCFCLRSSFVFCQYGKRGIHTSVNRSSFWFLPSRSFELVWDCRPCQIRPPLNFQVWTNQWRLRLTDVFVFACLRNMASYLAFMCRDSSCCQLWTQRTQPKSKQSTARLLWVDWFFSMNDFGSHSKTFLIFR